MLAVGLAVAAAAAGERLDRPCHGWSGSPPPRQPRQARDSIGPVPVGIAAAAVAGAARPLNCLPARPCGVSCWRCARLDARRRARRGAGFGSMLLLKPWLPPPPGGGGRWSVNGPPLLLAAGGARQASRVAEAPRGRARKANYRQQSPGASVARVPLGCRVLCCSVGEKYLSDACEPSVLSCGAVLVRSVATLNRGDPIDPGMYACARVCSHA